MRWCSPRSTAYRQRHGVLLHLFCPRQPRRTTNDRAPVRHHRPADMISGTYILSGALLAISAFLFNAGAAKRGHPNRLVVRHLLLRFSRRQRRVPHRQRDLSRRSAGQGNRGLLRDSAVVRGARPLALRDAHRNGQDHFKLFIGYLIGAGVMIIGGVVDIFLGVDAEQKSLEDIASPLSSVSGTFLRPVQHDRLVPDAGARDRGSLKPAQALCLDPVPDGTLVGRGL